MTNFSLWLDVELIGLPQATQGALHLIRKTQDVVSIIYDNWLWQEYRHGVTKDCILQEKSLCL